MAVATLDRRDATGGPDRRFKNNRPFWPTPLRPSGQPTCLRMRAYVAQAQQLPPGGVHGFASAFMIRMRAATMHWMTRWPLRRLVAG